MDKEIELNYKRGVHPVWVRVTDEQYNVLIAIDDAIDVGNKVRVAELIKEPNFTPSVVYNEPVRRAVMKKQYDILKLLLSNDKVLSVSTYDALDLAIFDKDVEALKILLSNDLPSDFRMKSIGNANLILKYESHKIDQSVISVLASAGCNVQQLNDVTAKRQENREIIDQFMKGQAGIVIELLASVYFPRDVISYIVRELFENGGNIQYGVGIRPDYVSGERDIEKYIEMKLSELQRNNPELLNVRKRKYKNVSNEQIDVIVDRIKKKIKN